MFKSSTMSAPDEAPSLRTYMPDWGGRALYLATVKVPLVCILLAGRASMVAGVLVSLSLSVLPLLAFFVWWSRKQAHLSRPPLELTLFAAVLCEFTIALVGIGVM